MKRFFGKHWLAVCLGIACIGIAIYVLEEFRALPDDTTVEKLLLRQGISLKQVHYSQGDIQKDIKWKMDAEEVKLSQDNSVVSFRRFHLTVEPKNRAEVQLKGRRGQYSRITGILRMSGNLRLRSTNGYSARSEHLVFDEKKGLLTTDDPVEILGPFFRLKGKGLYVDLKKEIFKVRSHVTTILNQELLG